MKQPHTAHLQLLYVIMARSN